LEGHGTDYGGPEPEYPHELLLGGLGDEFGAVAGVGRVRPDRRVASRPGASLYRPTPSAFNSARAAKDSMNPSWQPLAATRKSRAASSRALRRRERMPL